MNLRGGFLKIYKYLLVVKNNRLKANGKYQSNGDSQYRREHCS